MQKHRFMRFQISGLLLLFLLFLYQATGAATTYRYNQKVLSFSHSQVGNRRMAVRAAGLLLFRKLHSPHPQTEYLLLQSSNELNHWTPPKGHVEADEDDFTASLREVVEETGLSESQLKIFDGFKRTLHYNVGSKNKSVVYWLAQLKDANDTVTISNEHQAFKWSEVEEACKIAKYENIQNLIREVDNWIREKEQAGISF